MQIKQVRLRWSRAVCSICAAVLVFCGLMFSSSQVVRADAKGPYVNAKAAVVYDATTGEVLYDKEANTPMYPASTTKLMTAILLVKYLAPDAPIYMGTQACYQPKVRLGVKPGTVIPADDALRALLMKSANDVAFGIAETIGGSQAGFSRMMNVEARLLGCTHTQFITPNGLHADEHMTSAKDIALIMAEAVKHQRIIAAMQTKTHTVAGKQIRNTNRLLYGNSQIIGEYIGGKTGFTSKAMYCLATAAKQNDHIRISVVLGAPQKSFMYRETVRLLSWSNRQETADSSTSSLT